MDMVLLFASCGELGSVLSGGAMRVRDRLGDKHWSYAGECPNESD